MMVTKATMDVAVSDTCQIQWGGGAAAAVVAPDFEGANRDFMVRHTVGGIFDWFAGRTNASVVVYLSLPAAASWTLWLPELVLFGSSLARHADTTANDDDDDDSSASQTASSIHGRCAGLRPTNKSLMVTPKHKRYVVNRKVRIVSLKI
jgi:hypothetical protein